MKASIQEELDIDQKRMDMAEEFMERAAADKPARVGGGRK